MIMKELEGLKPASQQKVGGESNSFTSRGGVMHDKSLEGAVACPARRDYSLIRLLR